MNRKPAWILAGLLLACAPSQRGGTSAPPVDAFLPSGRNLYVFDFVQSRYQRWPAGDVCRLADTLDGAWSAAPNWLTLAAPGSPFAPMRAISGPPGHVYVLDRIGRRICHYDTSAQFLSCIPLPQELRDRNPDRLEILWTRYDLFTFLDLAEGAAWQFTETRAAGGQGEWRLLHKIRLPVNLASCLWEPWFRTPCCRLHATSGPADGADRTATTVDSAGTRCFDKYFNPLGGFPADARDLDSEDLRDAATGAALTARPESGGPGWRMTFDPGRACGEGGPRTCFHTDSRLLHPCPAGP